ncbi:GerMN domain-containing protein [Crystallibacter crystallopoietes]|uniref:GerMN domain-containing protein n=1 Tax=Crystallibacter crystallopoietes TaxID=37928 RepID=UPI001ED9BB60|nr:GerMN domain-containing protein [Arthrobacter crystallopoietes]
MKLNLAVPAAGAALLLMAGCAPLEPPDTSPATGNQEPGNTVTTPGPAAPTTASPPSGSGETASASALTLYYIAVDDAGASGETVGCGDSLIATYTEPVDSPDRLRDAMERLLADKGQFLGESGLYNSLYQSDLSFTAASIEADTATVELDGRLVSGGTCDDPRIEAQLEQTAATAAGTSEAVVLVNGERLEELLGGK